jgi:hypothetical protein
LRKWRGSNGKGRNLYGETRELQMHNYEKEAVRPSKRREVLRNKALSVEEAKVKIMAIEEGG